MNFDVETDSGVSGPPVASRPDEGMPTATTREVRIPIVPPLAPPPEEHVPDMRGQGVPHKSTQDQSLLVRNRQNSWMPGMRDSRSGEVTHTLADASHIKMPGTRAAEKHHRRRRNVVEIRIHVHWTRVEVRWIPSRRGQK